MVDIRDGEEITERVAEILPLLVILLVFAVMLLVAQKMGPRQHDRMRGCVRRVGDIWEYGLISLDKRTRKHLGFSLSQSEAFDAFFTRMNNDPYVRKLVRR